MKVQRNSRIDRIGVQAVGSQFEKAGYIFREQPISDYGIDAQVEIVEAGNATGKLIALQIKTGLSWFEESDLHGFIYRGDAEHLEYWIKHSLPVLIVLHNPETSLSIWQAVNPQNVIPTGKGWKILVPKGQRINPGMDVDIKRLIYKFLPLKNHTICNIEDSSHGLAKRYSLRVILNTEHTQSEIISLVEILTAEAVNCEYHRSDITREHWGNKPVNVVWLFFFPCAEDEANNNFICQTEWFSESLSDDAAPISIGGEQVNNGIKIKWNYNYSIFAKMYEENTIDKETFIIEISKISEAMRRLVNAVDLAINEYGKSQITFTDLSSVIVSDYEKVTSLYYEGTDVGISPYEGKRVSQKFQNLIAYAHNIYLFLGMPEAKKDRTEENIIWNIRSQLKYFKEAEKELQFELKEIR